MDLLKAIETNNRIIVLNALHDGYNVNAISFGSTTPLAYAVFLKCDLSILQILIDKGAYLNEALVTSCTSENIEAFELILKAGGNVNTVSKSDVPLVHLACLKGENYLKLLFLYGGDPNILSNQNETPLIFSIAQKCDITIIKLLLQFNANLVVKNNDGLDAEELALSMEAFETADLIRNKKKDILYARQRSGSNLEKNQTVLFELFASLKKAEKKLKSSLESKELHQRRLEHYETEYDSSCKTCVELRKSIAQYLSEESLDEKLAKKNVSAKRKLQFECPICFNDFDAHTRIYQCPEGHLICEDCKKQKTMMVCPQCSCKFPKQDIRNRALENIVAESSNY